MSIENIKALMDEFDPTKLLPNLDSALGKVELLMRVLLLIGPILLLVLGIAYLLAAPKEANYYFGYRCYFGMGSEEAWRFSQRIAGLVWGVAGLVLTIVMFVIGRGFAGMDVVDMVWKAVRCGIWEVAVVAITSIGINITVAVFFDRKGMRRRE